MVKNQMLSTSETARRDVVIMYFKIGSLPLEYCDSYKHLGVFFDEDMNFNKATDILADSAGRALGSIID